MSVKLREEVVISVIATELRVANWVLSDNINSYMHAARKDGT